MANLSTNGASWLIALSTSLMFSLLGLLVPNFYKQTKKPRAHNKPKLVNEFLGRHQLIYITYFLALSLTADFLPAHAWAKKLITLAIGTTFLAYVIGVYLTVHQDTYFEAHNCPDDNTCKNPVSLLTIVQMVWVNALTTIVLLAAAITAAFLVQ